MDVRFGNYEQFLDFFRKAPRNVQNILYKAYPDFAARMTNDYMNTTKKITSATNKAKDTIKEGIKSITAKPKATSTPNKNLDSAFDTLYGKGGQAAKATSKAKSNFSIKLPKGIKGMGNLAAKLAPIQGAINLFAGDSDLTDRLGGLGMIGTGLAATAGITGAAPLAGAFVVGDMLKKNVSVPVGEAIGDLIYKPSDIYYDPNIPTRIDITQAPNGKPYTPKELEKIIAYNNKIDAKIAAQFGNAMKPFVPPQEQSRITEQSGEIPSNLNNSTPSQSTFGFTPQTRQDAQQGRLNNYQDILQGNVIQPSLNPIVEPVNYSNAYSSSQGDIINQLQQNAQQPQPQGVQEQMVQNNDLYNIGDIRGKEPVGINYGDILNQYKAAMEADRQRNALNTLANMNNIQTQKAPIYYVGSQGDLRALEQDQTGIRSMLPTNTSSNVDQLKGQLAIQQAQYQDMLAQQKYQQDLINAQIAREDMINQANALAERFGGSPYMYMNKDIIGSLLKETINPNIQSQANIQEAIGKAPTQALLKAAEQRGDITGELDKIQLGKQYDAMIANINNNTKLVQTELEQSGLDRRTAATIANQAAMNEYTQLMENLRAGSKLENELELQRMKGINAKDVANIYTSRQTSGKQPQTQEDIMNEMLIEGVKSGVPIPQLLKYIELIGTKKGLTSAEDAELNR